MRIKKWDIYKDLALRSVLFSLRNSRSCESPFAENDCNYGFKPCPYAVICRAILEINEELVNPNYIEYVEL